MIERAVLRGAVEDVGHELGELGYERLDAGAWQHAAPTLGGLMLYKTTVRATPHASGVEVQLEYGLEATPLFLVAMVVALCTFVGFFVLILAIIIGNSSGEPLRVAERGALWEALQSRLGPAIDGPIRIA